MLTQIPNQSRERLVVRCGMCMEVPSALQIGNNAIDRELEEVELVTLVYAAPSSRLSVLGVTKMSHID